MDENRNYISDEELEQLICRVEQEELVAAPPDLMESILAALELEETRVMTEKTGLPPAKIVGVKEPAARKKEFYAYCFRVVTSVAAAVALVFLLPELSVRMEQNASSAEGNHWNNYRQEAPRYEDVVKRVPDKEKIVAANSVPTKEEVLDDSGFINRMLGETAWFSNSKEKNNE